MKPLKKRKIKNDNNSNNNNIIQYLLKSLTLIIFILIIIIIANLLIFKNFIFFQNQTFLSIIKDLMSLNFNTSELYSKKTKLLINNDKIIKYKGKNRTISEIINEYVELIPDKFEEEIFDEIKIDNYYLSLEEIKNDTKYIEEIKIKLLNEISKRAEKKITRLDTVFIIENGNFGTSLIALNNIIFYCEILGCKNIILNKYNEKGHWHIKNTIFSNKTNLTIMVGEPVDCDADNTVCSYLGNFFYFPMVVRVEIKINLIKNEILKNLPKVNFEKNDLFIHIKSGDFSNNYISSQYGQPPLCFYENIITNFYFNNIYLISKDKKNIIIDNLIKRYPSIKYSQNPLDKDIAYLASAYNIVTSISSFVIMIMKLNDNLKNVWEYDIYKIKEKFCHLHHHIFTFPIKYNIYTMKPSENYISEMFHWEKSESQLELMLEDNCTNNFNITKINL